MRDDSLELKQEAERLVHAYGQDVYRLCRMILQDASLAQDAVQETFLRAYRFYGGIKKPESEKAWLLTIAVRTCRNMLRSPWKKYVDKSVQVDELPLRAPDDESRGVLRAVLSLPPKLRAVTLLHYYYGFKARQIGDMMHLPLGTVLTQLKRSREKLKIMLTEGGETNEPGDQ